MKQIGSTTHLQVGVKEHENGTIRIKVEAYPLQSLAKAVQYLIEGICKVRTLIVVRTILCHQCIYKAPVNDIHVSAPAR